MYKFGKASLKRLSTLHPVMQVLMLASIQKIDFTVVCGERNEEDQTKAYNSGASKVKFPNSKHNRKPSLAVDVASWVAGDMSYDERESVRLATVILTTAKEFGIPVRWGGDWDRDGDLKDQSFNDLCHLELFEEEFRKTEWFKVYGL